MPPVFMTLPVNTRGIISTLSQDVLGSLQGAARNVADGINVQLGNSSYRIRYLPHIDNFSILCNADISSLHSVRAHLAITGNLDSLEAQLNQGRTTRSALDADRISRQTPVSAKIDSCSFSVERETPPRSAGYLTCPITLCIPENGVFARTSLQSDVCCLYDSTALKELVYRRLPHPVSREAITEAHIVPRDQCHFDSGKGAFVRSASELR